MRMALRPTSAFVIPCKAHGTRLLNDLFAPGPFKSVVLPAAKGILLNFKSDHVILLHKTLEDSQV